MAARIGPRECRIGFATFGSSYKAYVGIRRCQKLGMGSTIVYRSYEYLHWLYEVIPSGHRNVPDVSLHPCPADCLFDTPFIRHDGSSAQFTYSNACDGVVDLHFKIMADSGAFL